MGPAWYLSALIISLVFAYPLARYFRRIFTDIICPLSILIIYRGFFGQIQSVYLSGPLDRDFCSDAVSASNLQQHEDRDIRSNYTGLRICIIPY